MPVEIGYTIEGAVVIDMQGTRMQFVEGEVHRHHCPSCYEPKLCASVCEYEPDRDDEQYAELFGCVAQCSGCQRLFQAARLVGGALAIANGARKAYTERWWTSFERHMLGGAINTAIDDANRDASGGSHA